MTTVFYKHWSDIDKMAWDWKNFTPKEIASKGDGSILVDYDFMDRLQTARDFAGKPFYINSAYRDKDHNKKIGGSPNSMHLLGKAADISLVNFNKEELVGYLREAGFTGFGLSYNNFVHVDTGKKREW